jgi:hypothetical protein
MSEIDRKSHEDLALEVKQKADEATTILENLIQKTKESNSQEGLSFLDLKNFLVSISLVLMKTSFKIAIWIIRHP